MGKGKCMSGIEGQERKKKSVFVSAERELGRERVRYGGSSGRKQSVSFGNLGKIKERGK